MRGSIGQITPGAPPLALGLGPLPLGPFGPRLYKPPGGACAARDLFPYASSCLGLPRYPPAWYRRSPIHSVYHRPASLYTPKPAYGANRPMKELLIGKSFGLPVLSEAGGIYWRIWENSKIGSADVLKIDFSVITVTF